MTEREKLIEAMARAMCDVEYGHGMFDSPNCTDPIRAIARLKAQTSLAAIEAAGAVVVPVEDLVRVREILWENGETESEHGPLWLVRQMLAASPYRKDK